ncbi:hypothetical protein C0J52_04606 [Blattella germanica]|nr:hypothetical protein C0J52_04606 [Blattella germanica]
MTNIVSLLSRIFLFNLLKMPQELQVLRCYSCKIFQVQIVKKSNKWDCKMCGEKQSLKKVYARGSGRDCRLHVQRLNEMCLKGEEQVVNNCDYTVPEFPENIEEKANINKPNFSSANLSKWCQFLEVPEEEDTDDVSPPSPLISKTEIVEPMMGNAILENSTSSAYNEEEVLCLQNFFGNQQRIQTHENDFQWSKATKIYSNQQQTTSKQSSSQLRVEFKELESNKWDKFLAANEVLPSHTRNHENISETNTNMSTCNNSVNISPVKTKLKIDKNNRSMPLKDEYLIGHSVLSSQNRNSDKIDQQRKQISYKNNNFYHSPFTNELTYKSREDSTETNEQNKNSKKINQRKRKETDSRDNFHSFDNTCTSPVKLFSSKSEGKESQINIPSLPKLSRKDYTNDELDNILNF